MSLSRTNLLIVDDDASIRAMLREYPANQGHAVRAVGDGQSMRAQIDRELADLVLLDLRLPGEDGLTLARRLFDLSAGGEEVPMTAMETDLTRACLANPDRVLSRDQLLMRARYRECEPFDRSNDIRVGRLRRKVEPGPRVEPRCLRTVRNGGYLCIPGN